MSDAATARLKNSLKAVNDENSFLPCFLFVFCFWYCFVCSFQLSERPPYCWGWSDWLRIRNDIQQFRNNKSKSSALSITNGSAATQAQSCFHFRRKKHAIVPLLTHSSFFVHRSLLLTLHLTLFFFFRFLCFRFFLLLFSRLLSCS